jgi:hypothetical protein
MASGQALDHAQRHGRVDAQAPAAVLVGAARPDAHHVDVERLREMGLDARDRAHRPMDHQNPQRSRRILFGDELAVAVGYWSRRVGHYASASSYTSRGRAARAWERQIDRQELQPQGSVSASSARPEARSRCCRRLLTIL